MNTIRRTGIGVLMARILGIAAFASYAALSQEVPFHGTVQQEETQIIDFPRMSVQGSGTGNATYLGSFTQTFEHEVDLLTGLGTGVARFTGRNGDQLFTEISALGVPIHTGVFVVMERHLISGGTGRFEGATGTLILVRFFDARLSLVSHGTIEGTIVLAKEK